MVIIIGRGTSSDNRALKLYTMKHRFVENEMPLQIPLAGMRDVANAIEARYAARLISASSLYNCYGFAFASRRTAIMDGDEVTKILQDDGYRELPWDAREWDIGDVVLYKTQGDPISHVAVIHHKETHESGEVRDVYVVSAWGPSGEYIHPIDPRHDNLGTPYRVVTQRVVA